MGLAVGSLHPPAASSRDESRASCLFSHWENLGFFQVVSWAAGDVREERLGEKSRVILDQGLRKEV